MRLTTDTREQDALTFSPVVGVEYERKGLSVGDYAAWHKVGADWVQDEWVVERKGVGDLFNSFTSGYENERAKILRAQQLNLRYILAIEANSTEIRKGHSYWAQGELREHKKSGMAMIRQLMTLQRKYDVRVWFCSSRTEMAWMVQEWFLARERVK